MCGYQNQSDIWVGYLLTLLSVIVLHDAAGRLAGGLWPKNGSPGNQDREVFSECKVHPLPSDREKDQ